MPQAVSYDEIAERIDVRRPYYALEEVTRATDGTVEASVAPIQALGVETGPITAADAARHMAIAGSVAAGLDNPAAGRHMYLAYDAEFRRSRQRPPEDATDLRITARHTWIDPGVVHALAILRTAEGAAVNTLSVYYLVMAHDDFFGFFADNQRPALAAPGDPYREVIGLERAEVDGGRLRASLGEIDERFCVGHFDGLPAMPVAYLMSNVLDANAQLLQQLLDLDAVQYTVREGSVRAEALAFAGERVDIEVEYQQFAGGAHWLHSRATVGGEKSVGALHTKLRVRNQPAA